MPFQRPPPPVHSPLPAPRLLRARGLRCSPCRTPRRRLAGHTPNPHQVPSLEPRSLPPSSPGPLAQSTFGAPASRPSTKTSPFRGPGALTPVLQGLPLLFSGGWGRAPLLASAPLSGRDVGGGGWRWGERLGPYPSFLRRPPDGEPGAGSPAPGRAWEARGGRHLTGLGSPRTGRSNWGEGWRSREWT